MTIGERIVEQRKKLGMTRVQLAQDLDIPHTTLRNYETDQREPGHKTLIALSQRFGVTTDYLLLGNDESVKIKKSTTPEGAEDHISMDESNRLFDALVNAGLIDDSMNFSEEDDAFFSGIAQLINAWVMSHRR